MRKKSEKHSYFRNLSVDLSADASADAPAIINIRKAVKEISQFWGEAAPPFCFVSIFHDENVH